MAYAPVTPLKIYEKYISAQHRGTVNYAGQLSAWQQINVWLWLKKTVFFYDIFLKQFYSD